MIRPIVDQSIIAESRKVDVSLYNLNQFQHSLALKYAVNSKFTDLKIKKLSKRTANFYNPFVLGKAAQPFKHYHGCPIISLKEYDLDEHGLERDLFETIGKRRSYKEFQRYYISLSEIHYLMRYSYGPNRWDTVSNDGETYPWLFRPIPSPGGLFASEIYLVVLNGQVEKGIYHYRPDIHAIELIKPGDFSQEMKDKSGAGMYIKEVEDLSMVILTTSMIERLYIKYGERAYRFMMMEVGFVGQTLSLLVEALGLGCCMLGGYYDDDLNDLLDIDGIFETVQNVMVVGKPQSSTHE